MRGAALIAAALLPGVALADPPAAPAAFVWEAFGYLRLQYLAGLGLNLYQSGPIYAEILRHKKYPEGLFSGSPETMQKLRDAIASAPGGDPQ